MEAKHLDHEVLANHNEFVVDDAFEVGLQVRVGLLQNVEELDAINGPVGNVYGVVGLHNGVSFEIVLFIHDFVRLVLESENIIDLHHIIPAKGQLAGDLGEIGGEEAREDFLDLVFYVKGVHDHFEVIEANGDWKDLVFGVALENQLYCELQLLLGHTLDVVEEGLEEVLKGLFFPVVLVVQAHEVIFQQNGVFLAVVLLEKFVQGKQSQIALFPAIVQNLDQIDEVFEQSLAILHQDLSVLQKGKEEVVRQTQLDRLFLVVNDIVIVEVIQVREVQFSEDLNLVLLKRMTEDLDVPIIGTGNHLAFILGQNDLVDAGLVNATDLGKELWVVEIPNHQISRLVSQVDLAFLSVHQLGGYLEQLHFGRDHLLLTHVLYKNLVLGHGVEVELGFVQPQLHDSAWVAFIGGYF